LNLLQRTEPVIKEQIVFYYNMNSIALYFLFFSLLFFMRKFDFRTGLLGLGTCKRLTVVFGLRDK